MFRQLLAVMVGVTVAVGAEVVQPTPVLEFKLNEGEGTVVNGTGSAPVKLEIKNPAMTEWGAGRLGGKALYFKNPVDGKKRGGCGTILGPAAGTMDFTKPFTVMAWLKLDETIVTNGPQYSVIGNQAGDYGPGFRLLYSWGTFRLAAGDGKKGAAIAIVPAKVPLDCKAWNHIAATSDGKTAKLFWNGIEAASGEMSILPGKKQWEIGSYGYGYAYGFAGALSEVKFYQEALTPEQVLAEAQKE